MSDFVPIGKSISEKHAIINDNNDSGNTEKYDINGNPGKKLKVYALNKDKFKPNTEESQLAEIIATELNDLDNFACWYKKVKDYGVGRMMSALENVKSDMTEKANTKYPVRSPAKYLLWKLNTGKC